MIKVLASLCALAIFVFMVPNHAMAAENERYQIVNINRDVPDGKVNRTVSGTMMLDSETGRSWILDEQKGRWIPVGYRNVKPSSDVTLIPGKLK